MCTNTGFCLQRRTSEMMQTSACSFLLNFKPFLLPANEGVWLLWGGMHGCSRGVCVVLFGGHVWFYLGAYVVLFGGACVVLFGGACMVLFGGHAWFYSGGHVWLYSGGMCGFIWGGVHGFIWGACVVLFGGACMVFSVFSDTMRYGQ